MAGFLHVRGKQELRKVLITNSAAIKVGAPVKLTAALAVPSTAGAADALGMCVGVCNIEGKPVADIDYGDTFTAEADNQTVDQIYAIVDTSKESEWEVAPDAALGTTTTSALPFQFFDITSAINVIDESSVSATTGTFFSLAVLDNGNLIVKFNELLA